MALSKGDYKYQRLVNILERDVHLDCRPGGRFPAELDLCERFKLNRLTVHRAITLLAKKCLLVQKGPIGYKAIPADEVVKDYPLFEEGTGLESLVDHVRNGESIAVITYYDYAMKMYWSQHRWRQQVQPVGFSAYTGKERPGSPLQ